MPKEKHPRTDKVASEGWSGDVVLAPLEFTYELEEENQKLTKEVEQLKKRIHTLHTKLGFLLKPPCKPR